MRGPDAPSGWPIAIAPPLGLTRLSSNGSSSPRRQARTCVAKASLISMTSMSFSVRPARSSAFFAAGTGPKPMMRGSTPATPVDRMRAIGLAPATSPAFLLATIIATAPSLMPEALPAVGAPVFDKGANFGRVPGVMPGRGFAPSAAVTAPALAAGDGLGRDGDRVEPRAAVALQHRARNLDRQPGDERGVARDAAAVLAALVGAADDDVLDLVGGKAAVGDDLGDDAGEHVVG